MRYLISILLVCVVAVISNATASANNDQKKVLFFTNSERGLANVVLATAHAMLIDHPEIDVYLASFAKLENAVLEVSESAKAQSPDARSINFEVINGVSYTQVFQAQNRTMEESMNDPGIRGFTKFTKNLESYLVPWSGPQYVEIYYDLVEKLKRIEPDVVVLDTVLSPALDATRDLDRKHVMLSANQLKDHFAQSQPYGEMFWKIPAMNSAYAYPVPWYLIPANIYLSIRLIISALWTPTLTEKRAYIKSQGLKNPVNILTSFRKDVPWLSPSVPELEFPLALPDNVICTGPIFLDQGEVKDRDPTLAAWLAQRPTIFINLGSHVNYNENDAIQMVGALSSVLNQTDTQVLWKFNKRYPYTDDFLAPVAEHIKSGRFRLENWIDVDIAAVLKTGNIAVFVHHGGANSFYEGLATGVPTVVLPVWIDLYDYAVRTEWLGIGIWGSRQTAPDWTANELGSAFMKILNDTEESRLMKLKAKQAGELTKTYGGRKMAAQAIVDYINQGSQVKKPTLTDIPDREL